MNVYKRLANKELLLHKIIHEALIWIKSVKTVSSSAKRKIRIERKEQNIPNFGIVNLLEADFIKIDNLTDDAKDYLIGARDHLIRERTKEQINLRRHGQQFINNFHEDFLSENIKIPFSLQKILITKWI